METELRIRPHRAEFEALAASWPLVPVWTELLADVSTPVGLFNALAGGGSGILLESVERSERWGRYSFVAGDPRWPVVVGALWNGKDTPPESMDSGGENNIRSITSRSGHKLTLQLPETEELGHGSLCGEAGVFRHEAQAGA